MNFTVEELIEDMDYEIVHQADNIKDIKIYTSEVNRPGLQLCGYYGQFVANRIQVIGGAEWHYLNELDPHKRLAREEELLKKKIPLLIITRGNKVFDELKDLAKKYNRTILRTQDSTSRAINKLINYMDQALAPTIRCHGILLDVYGVGVLIRGESGIGKSETAIDLIEKGHKLISDDSVIIKRLEGRLVGTSPPITRHFMEIRGVGIVDVQRLFGIGSVMEEKEIEVLINLEHWDQNRDYDRLGIEYETEALLGVEIPRMDIPLRTGRNTAVILEIAIRNFKQKELGYNPALALNNKIMESIKSKKKGGRS
ncbi:MAG: HPr(Ser) kinase/phosphatase [Tissierellia bacterium]|nr:HPr(Ser) kinase/phosphatase [Tissierellia bacterium]